jgi:fibronectin-binding autotransporter adhesin
MPACSQTTWNGGTGNWSNPLNWSSGLPDQNSGATIGNGASPNPIAVLDINAITGGVSLNSAGVLIAPGNSLTTDNLVLSGTNSFVTGATGAETLNVSSISGYGTISNVGIGQTHITATGGTLTIATSSLGLGTADSANFSLTVDAGSALNITGGPFKNLTSNFPVISYDIKGTLKFDNAVISNLGQLGSLVLDGAAAQIVNESGTNPFAQGLLIGFHGGAGNPANFEMRNGAQLTTGDFQYFSFGPYDSGASITGGSKLTTLDFADGKGFGVDASSLNVNGNATIGDWSENAGLGITNGSSLHVTGSVIADRLHSPALFVGIGVDGGSIAIVGKDLVMANGSDTFFRPETTISNGSAMSVGGSADMTGYCELNVTDGSTLSVQKDIAIDQMPNGNGGLIGGVVTIANGSAATVNGSVLNNSGSVQIDHSSVLTAKSGFTQTGAGATLVDGLMNVGGTGMQIQDGSLSGNGVINGNVIMGGTLTPGDPTGAMTILGNYTQTSTGTLVQQVGWINGFSKNPLFVVGNATLDGTLDIQSMLGYFPELGDSFILMLFNSSTGTFSNLQGLDFGGGIGFVVEYDQHDVKLVAKEVPEPGVLALFAGGLLALAGALSKNKYRQLA